MGKVLILRLKDEGTSGHGCFSYKNEIRLDDYKQLAIILSDLSDNGGKVEKAFLEFKKRREESSFPW